MPATRILAIGDVHLGRQSSRLPSPLTDRLGAGALGPAAALRRAVDVAIGELNDADSLLLLVEREGRTQYVVVKKTN